MPAYEGTFFEFGSPEALLLAIDAARSLGFQRFDAFTPFAVPELDEALRMRRTRIPRAVLLAGAAGCALAYLILWACNAYDYPLIVGGRPFNSQPADIPIMFETMILFAGTTAFFSVLLLSGMPRLHHPFHEVPGHESSTLDRFWLAVDDDVRADEALRGRLMDLGALAVRRRGDEA